MARFSVAKGKALTLAMERALKITRDICILKVLEQRATILETFILLSGWSDDVQKKPMIPCDS